MDTDEIASIIKKFMRTMGLNEALAKIYSILAVSNSPLCINEISNRTGYSPTMIYTAIRYLIENDLVERVKDGKNIKYTANINFLDLFENKRKKILEEYIEPLSKIDLSEYNDNKKIKKIKEYAINIKEYFKRVNMIKNENLLMKNSENPDMREQ
ncbi:MAG: helix-turn-helix domain-containing protein [Thermoplasmata archaeon]